MADHLPQRVRVERRPVDEAESRRANGPDWDRVELLVEEAWRCIAGPRLIKEWATGRGW